MVKRTLSLSLNLSLGTPPVRLSSTRRRVVQGADATLPPCPSTTALCNDVPHHTTNHYYYYHYYYHYHYHWYMSLPPPTTRGTNTVHAMDLGRRGGVGDLVAEYAGQSVCGSTSFGHSFRDTENKTSHTSGGVPMDDATIHDRWSGSWSVRVVLVVTWSFSWSVGQGGSHRSRLRQVRLVLLQRVLTVQVGTLRQRPGAHPSQSIAIGCRPFLRGGGGSGGCCCCCS